MNRLIFAFYFLLLSCLLQAKNNLNNDTIHVIPHNKTLMITDPSRGVNEVLKWGVFPSQDVPYRKVTLHLTMQCPDGMKCGAWDYLDYVIIRRTGGASGISRNAEIVRNLTPYGAWFDNQWKFTWEQDITDWGCLLRDSVEIEYQHTGFESTDAGWLITVDFEIITGRPVMEPLGYDCLWDKSYAYGDTLNPFDTRVTPQTRTMPKGSKYANLRIMQTGHGMDRPGNCSEFCTKWREIFFDNQMIDHRDMTIICGNNPVYPQAGTWVYSRSNWCPGSLAIPDIFILPVTQSQHTFGLKMEPYISDKPSGGWLIAAHAFYYKSPSAQHDVALEKIIAPSTLDAYGRINPICASPRILIKNNGSDNLQSVMIEYGLQGRKKQQYRWTGELTFLQTLEILLPGTIEPETDSTLFEVRLSLPNGKKDEYIYDNAGRSIVREVPVYSSTMIVSFLTNKNAKDTSWELFDSQNNTVYKLPADSLKAESLYNDTLHLPEGCYEWIVTDISNDGLSFWANPDAGYGYIRLLDGSGNLLKSFGSDFGTSIRHSFRVNKNKETSVSHQNSFELTSARVRKMTGMDIILSHPQDIVIRIMNNENQVVSENFIKKLSSCLLQLDVSYLSEGTYQIQLEAENGEKLTKRLRKI